MQGLSWYSPRQKKANQPSCKIVDRPAGRYFPWDRSRLRHTRMATEIRDYPISIQRREDSDVMGSPGNCGLLLPYSRQVETNMQGPYPGTSWQLARRGDATQILLSGDQK
ncbi:Protein of unknown function [Pyronema omphalodes CBS 100304]|uniref:Uncharacterized protein n=1 Tax=Pyronema omphalodes (strain CBS 100304) TaxID=1076935 RepID=U4KU49_PYROM|nr:Protein of unknown function [Pyronema omphalodes CBS 100304]